MSAKDKTLDPERVGRVAVDRWLREPCSHSRQGGIARDSMLVALKAVQDQGGSMSDRTHDWINAAIAELEGSCD